MDDTNDPRIAALCSALDEAWAKHSGALRRYQRAITAAARAAASSDANAIAHADGMVLCARSVLGSAYVDMLDARRRLNAALRGGK